MASMIDVRRSCMQDNAPVPAEYQAVPYVVGNGYASVIDTGVQGDNDNLRFKFCFMPEFFYAYISFFGNYLSPETNNCWRLLYTQNVNQFYVTRNRITNSSAAIYPTVEVANNKVFCDISLEKAVFTIDGEYKSNNQIKIDGTHNNTNIAIGNRAVLAGGASGRLTRWYYFRIFDNGVLIRNYVPCYRKSDSIGGFWESVNKQFVRSIGSVDFAVPS